MNDTTSKQSFFPRWLLLFLAFMALNVVVLYFIDFQGDRATSNIIMMSATLLAFLVTLVWFLQDKRRSSRLRLGVFGAVAATVIAVFSLFSVEFSGALIPQFESRFAKASWDALDAPSATGRPVDLATTTPYDFAGFLGSDRNNRVEGVRLLTDFTERGPEELWRRAIGEGLSGFAVVNGFAVTLEQRGEEEVATLYDVDNGDLIWATVIDSGDTFGNAIFGVGPRSTPQIDQGVVYAISVHGKLVALDGQTGDVIWKRDLLADYGGTLETESSLYGYGRAGSPLIVQDMLIVPAGGAPGEKLKSLAALNKATGETIWEAGDHQISMSSPSYANLGGRRQILSVNEDWVTGHALETGDTLWQFELPGKSTSNANVSQAVAVGADRLFASKGYGIGSALYQLEANPDGTFTPKEIWQKARSLRTKFTNVAIRDGYIYGLSEGVLECVELETGERAWKHGRYGHGQLLLVGETLVILTEDGEVVYVEATPERKDNVLARFEVLEGRTWNPFALAGDRLVVRNGKEAAVYRVPLER